MHDLPPEMDTLDRAVHLATLAHAGQTDRAGEAYIQHPLRVMAAVDGETAKAVAALHDTVEDSEFTLSDLQDAGIPDRVVEAVEHLTKQEGEVYEDYVSYVLEDPIAVRVKLADLEDNMDATRLPDIDDADLERLRKYHQARERLLDAVSDE